MRKRVSLAVPLLFSLSFVLPLQADVVLPGVSIQNGNVKVNTGGTRVDIQGGSVQVETDGEAGDSAGATGGTVKATGSRLVIEGNDRRVSQDCKGLDVVISGNSNVVTLKGECRNVEVSGNEQVVTLSTVASITVTGIENKVSYLKGAGGKAPKISKTGIDNTVSKRDK